VYLTVYYGKLLPIFYIGSTTTSKINNGYKGSVSSKKYGEIWKSELRNNQHLFKTRIVSIHDTREEAFIKEEKLQKQLNVIKNPLYVNKSFANSKFSLKQHTPWTRKKFKSRTPWNKGKTGVYTESTLLKMSTARTGRSTKCSDETKSKLSVPNPKKANYGSKNGMYRKTHSDEVKQDSSERATKTFKGKSYEQLYGEEKATSLRNSRSEHMKSHLAANPDKRLGSVNPNAKSYEFISPAGEVFVTTGNLKTFCKENGLRCDSIINVLKGREPEHRGWKARYI